MTPIRSTSPWTIWLFFSTVFLGFLFLLPNFFQDKAVVEFHSDMNQEQINILKILFPSLRVESSDKKSVFLLDSVDEQLLLYQQLRKSFPLAQMNLNLRSQVPAALSSIGLKPMKLGLDLRGGVHFLLSVDTDFVIDKKIEASNKQLQQWLKQKYPNVAFEQQQRHQSVLSFSSAEELQKVAQEISTLYPEYAQLVLSSDRALQLETSHFYKEDQHNSLIQTTLTSLRQRINELGVAEASVYTQGHHYVVVDLPGIQDVQQAKELLGKTATVEFYLVSQKNLPASSPVPPGVHRKKDPSGQHIDVVGRALLSGQDIMMAQAGSTQDGRPCVDLRISTEKAQEFRRVTAENVGRLMAVIYVEFSNVQRWDEKSQDFISVPQTTEKILNVARIETALGDRFQITGLSREASLNVALMLRAGSLPAPVHIAEEKILGPSMGVENIRMGLSSLLLGISLIAVFMTWYYRTLGVITNLVLLCNLVILVMLLSLIQATLTLTGIAGIVLTLGMAVDANVIIFERVRDEMRRGIDAWKSLDIGLEKATETILDSNITTMIIGVVLFFLGSGSVKGFAITLILGLITSVFTSLVGTRVIVWAFYRHQSQPNLDFLLAHNNSKEASL